MNTAITVAIIGGLVAVFSALLVIFVASKKKKDNENEK